ncbi:MAG: SurA N-terminal domain-containing protein [Treponema sp.]|jgi:PAS domain-containing protein|nr:SurA N-terminal domain-containing protein [Treponema sp.]
MAIKEKKAQPHEDSEMMRRFKANPGVFIGTVIVLVLVVVSFVLVPAIVPQSGRGGMVDLTFGSYDKVPISYVPGNHFAQYYGRVASSLQNSQNSMDPNNSQYINYQIWRTAFEAAAVHIAILQEMKKAGYAVSAKTVDREVAMLPQFQENGRFSAALYQRYDDNERLNLWRQMQDDLVERQFLFDNASLLTSGAEADFIGKMASPQRSFNMVSFQVDKYPDSEYIAYAQRNPSMFRAVHLSRITVSSGEREARQILDSIIDGTTTFEDAARAYSQDMYADRGGDMGIKLVNELFQELFGVPEREKLFVLARGEYSEIINSGQSWMFFRAERDAENADFSDEATMEKVRAYVRNFERGRMEDWTIAQAEAFSALVTEYGFDDALYRQGIGKQSFGPVPINYGDVDLFTPLSSASISELYGSSSNENFWKIAFSTPLNSPSEPLVQGGNVLVLFPTEEINAEEESIESIASYFSSYSFWGRYITESIHSYFMNSDKMEDKFMETYFRYFMGE